MNYFGLGMHVRSLHRTRKPAPKQVSSNSFQQTDMGTYCFHVFLSAPNTSCCLAWADQADVCVAWCEGSAEGDSRRCSLQMTAKCQRDLSRQIKVLVKPKGKRASYTLRGRRLDRQQRIDFVKHCSCLSCLIGMIISGDLSIFSGIPFCLASCVLSLNRE